ASGVGTEIQTGDVRYLRVFNFLRPEEVERLLAFAAARNGEMLPSAVTDWGSGEARLDESYRRSRVELERGPIWPLLETRLAGLLPEVCEALGVEGFPMGQIERQMTVHEDGGVFGRH